MKYSARHVAPPTDSFLFSELLMPKPQKDSCHDSQFVEHCGIAVMVLDSFTRNITGSCSTTLYTRKEL